MLIRHNFTFFRGCGIYSCLGKAVGGLVTAVVGDSGIDNFKRRLHNLLRNPCLYLSVLFCCLEHQMHKGFVIQSFQNVFQPSRTVTLPLMSVLPISMDALMILKILYGLLSLDRVQSVPYNS